MQIKQGVALTGRNTIGPLWSVARQRGRWQCYRRHTMCIA